MAVLDSNFRVYGVSNLRVVDASSLPKIPGMFIVSSVCMIGEKASDAILADAGHAKLPRGVYGEGFSYVAERALHGIGRSATTVLHALKPVGNVLLALVGVMWHGLKLHIPRGGINRARRDVMHAMHAMQDVRLNANGLTRFGPDELTGNETVK